MGAFVVKLTSDAEKDLLAITDVRTRRGIANGLLRLEDEPTKRGKPLVGRLQGYRAIKISGRRYRAIYDISLKKRIVTIISIGIRKDGDKHDAYQIAHDRMSGF